MASKCFLLVVAAALSVFTSSLAQMQMEREIRIEQREGSGDNRLRLVCLSRPINNPQLVDFMPDATAVFMWESGDLVTVFEQNDVTFDFEDDGAAVIFTITRDVEGNFYCQGSVGADSQPELLVVRPMNSDRIVTPPVQFTTTDSNVLLPCLVAPGRERDRYSATWYKGDDDFLICQPGCQREPISPRYSMAEDFTLEINPAKFFDTSSEYHCVVSVNDPQIGPLTYTRTMTVNISLTVLSGPDVALSGDKAISLWDNEASTDFICNSSIHGDDIPTEITWTHRGREITNSAEDREKYRISSNTSMTVKQVGLTSVEIPVFTTASFLTIRSLDQFDSGVVNCTATPSGSVLSADSASRDFNVLSAMINRSEVIITTRGEAQFQLLLPTALPGTINLLIHLLDMETQVEQDIVSDQSFTNADQVFFRLQTPPYRRFKAQAALQIGSHQGPFHPQELSKSPVYDVSEPTCGKLSLAEIGIIAGVSSGAFIVAAVIAGIVACCCCCKYSKRSKDIKQKSGDKLAEVIHKQETDFTAAAHERTLEVVGQQVKELKSFPDLNGEQKSAALLKLYEKIEIPRAAPATPSRPEHRRQGCTNHNSRLGTDTACDHQCEPRYDSPEIATAHTQPQLSQPPLDPATIEKNKEMEMLKMIIDGALQHEDFRDEMIKYMEEALERARKPQA